MAHVRQSAPDSSHGFEVSAPKTLKPFPFGSDTEAGMLRKLRLLEDPKKGVVLQVLAHVRQSGPYSGACSTVRIIFWYM